MKYSIVIDELKQVCAPEMDGVTIVNEGPITITVTSKDKVELDVELFSVVDVNYVFEKNTDVKLVEKRKMNSDGIMCHDMIAKDNAHILAVLLNQGNHTGTLTINETNHVYRDAFIEVSYGELGDGSIEANYTYELDGENANAHLHLAAISIQKDKKHYQVTLNHHQPNTTGIMENYGVTRHEGTLVFDGVGRIEKGMHQSNSHQTSRIIVFEPKCVAKANPYLFIDDYDVKASHAASVGAMNEDHLYYLQSRGLTKKQSMHLITLGYLLPAISIIEDEAIIHEFEDTLLRKVGEN